MKPVDWHTSEKVRNAVNAQLGECVANVARAFLKFPDLLPNDAVYVEGLWKLGGQLNLHAWIETQTSIIDPTLALQSNTLLREGVGHYAIQSLVGDEIVKRFRKRSIEPGVVFQVELGWDDARVEKLAHEVDPP